MDAKKGEKVPIYFVGLTKYSLKKSQDVFPKNKDKSDNESYKNLEGYV